jgi:hypothetical protein
LDRLSSLNPKTAVAGHKTTGAPDTPDAIEDSKNVRLRCNLFTAINRVRCATVCAAGSRSRSPDQQVT